MRTPRLRLRSIVGRNYNVDPSDTRDTKIALRDLRYIETPSFGITPYSDADMFEGVEDFQDDFDLRKDGVMTPNGETERKLNEVIDLNKRVPEVRLSSVAPEVTMPKLGPSTGDGSESSTPKPSEIDRQQVVALPVAIPIIVYEIAMYFGMSLAAAYAWWLLRSPEEKRHVQAQILRFTDGEHAQTPATPSVRRYLRSTMTRVARSTRNGVNELAQDAMLQLWSDIAHAVKAGRKTSCRHWIHGTNRTDFL